MKDSVDLLELLWIVWKKCVVAVWHRLEGGFLFETRKEMWDSFVFISKHRYVYVEELCVCVCLCMHWQCCLFPFFLSSSLSFLSLNLSSSLFLSHLHSFNVSLLIWRWLCLPWCTSPRQQGPRAGLALLCQELCLPFFFFPSSCLQRDERNNKKKSRKPVCQITKK